MPQDSGALEGLLAGLSSVAGDAAAQLGPNASEKAGTRQEMEDGHGGGVALA